MGFNGELPSKLTVLVRAVFEVFDKEFGVHRSAHQNKTQLGTQRQQVSQRYKEKVAVAVTLVNFILRQESKKKEDAGTKQQQKNVCNNGSCAV